MNLKSFKKRRGMVSRADLFLLLQMFPKENFTHIAEMLGYYKRLRRNKRDFTNPTLAFSRQRIIEHKVEETFEDERGLTESKLKAFYWYPVLRERVDEPSSSPLMIEELGDGHFPQLKKIPPPPFVPIQSWSAVWPKLRNFLSQKVSSHDLEEKRVIELIATAKALSSIPRKKRKKWARQLTIIVDYSKRNFPFWSDYNLVIANLTRLLGKDRVKVFYSRTDDLTLLTNDSDQINIFECLSEKDVLLILSDLGAYGEDAERILWQHYSDLFHQKRVKPTVLTPVPKRAWNVHLAKTMHVIEFSDSSSNILNQNEPKLVEQLLSLCSLAVRVEPQLLRALRQLIPNSDIGIEGVCWNHIDMDTACLACSLSLSARKKYQNLLIESDFPLSLVFKAKEIIKLYHGWLPPEIQLEEEVTQVGILNMRGEMVDCHYELALSKNAKHYLGWMKFQREKVKQNKSVQEWAKRMGFRQHKSVLGVSGANILVQYLAEVFQESSVTSDFPEVISENDLAFAKNRQEALVRTLQIKQVGGSLLLEAENIQSGEGQNPVLIEIEVQERLEIKKGENNTERLLVQDAIEVDLPRNGSISLRSSKEVIELSAMQKPDWAESIYQLLDGLYATLPLNDSKIKWIMNSFKEVEKYNPLLGKSDKQLAIVERGDWVNISQLERLKGIQDLNMSWAIDSGIDQYGLFADMELLGVVQRMRWINSGEFLMGSSLDELGRTEFEDQFYVILTNGFWMADTTCTNALWTAVMEEKAVISDSNRMLPVTGVSWEECRIFLSRLSHLIGDYGFVLPSEAQWEYACRAGVDTAYSFGNHIDDTQANFYEEELTGDRRQGGSGVKAVKEFPCNQWGLFQMHGNVWEWCADWYAPYPKEKSVDYTGSVKGGEHVLRGGSYFSTASGIRSASRGRLDLDVKFGSQGFRFAIV
ncbi:formylglycine-generating enzyme family protein [Halodesulfovibrio marinisediminis]|uniref:Formylglycine-generating enzyme, required for sulfatase activity, contains SUMF1/FGE domain n=1 Tax=Halodesulfovibrio marinisediminis DSM 17456 TaxID=1121457 RepID=A0A1N6JAF4_9BACT|nr:formylglycine-generating enzyme family protein [Halodesulfovibrio marinisediminis]SIO41282.1 Formylglycine-generating enzyme, required for sulfatase activity, contains SUMF1/FGE domain [Halodesulfovibrio marinisediminis DSM 17456]